MDGGGGWTHDLRVPSPRGEVGDKSDSTVSRNSPIQAPAYSLLKQEELQPA